MAWRSDEKMSDAEHIPVLVDKVVELLVTRKDGFYVDATVGTGGHAEAILNSGSDKLTLLGVDCDEKAVEVAKRRLAVFGSRVNIICGHYTEMKSYLSGAKCDGFLLDLGLSSLQLADRSRGFSYMTDSRLDMSMGRMGRSVVSLLNRASADELAEILFRFGEEPRSRAIARKIVQERQKKKIDRTFHLRRIVESAVRGRTKIRSLSRVFQALRIWANNELENISRFLEVSVELLKPGGRIAVISYHSLEDRIVKRFFRDEEKGCVCPPDFPMCVCGGKKRLKVVTRRVIKPSKTEIESNPRARSARLRVAERLEDEKNIYH